MHIKDATFLVTGGGSGLGAATVRELVRGGGNCIVADVNEEAGRGLASELGKAARFARTDVTDEASVQAAIDEAVRSFGSLRGAVNCAGIGIAARVLGRDGVHDLGVFSSVIQINLIGTFNVIRLAAAAISQAPPLDDGERGVIVNTASVAAYDGQIGQAAYSASKGGVVGMTLPIAREFAKLGIRVVTIAPGLFNTPMMAALPEEAKKSLARKSPSRRGWASPPNSRRWCGISPRTSCSTAKRSASTAQSAWRRSRGVALSHWSAKLTPPVLNNVLRAKRMPPGRSEKQPGGGAEEMLAVRRSFFGSRSCPCHLMMRNRWR